MSITKKLTQGQKVVVVVDSKDARQNSITEIESQVGKQNVHISSGVEKFDKNSIEAVVVFGVTSPSDDILGNILEYMKPGANIIIQEESGDGKATLQRLMLSGFVDYVASPGTITEITAAKPDWEVGATQSLKLSSKPKTTTNAPVNIWNSTEEGDDVIDEDSLLSESDRTSKPKVTRDDCEVGPKKKACKNCTCGRAEEEAKDEAASRPKLTLDMIENPGVNSNCGSCSLGDAFRCGGCPYRGLPAFKVGERIQLPDNYMQDDI
eukprot:TRINITY_DN2088_c0_g1_i1.p1 TRINITY_DN2088_c0_g1~~TRINITY_DN2088_c0_g1_i1.p1  ORF type:complete len:265 (-),score=74.88 TRINITY_DN2088_c0_g1_i1:90-884(-)